MWFGTYQQVYHGYSIFTYNGLTLKHLYKDILGNICHLYGGSDSITHDSNIQKTQLISWIKTLSKHHPSLYVFLSGTIFSKILLADTQTITNRNSGNLTHYLLTLNPGITQATRQANLFSTTGCVYWQLHYIILYQFWIRNNETMTNLITQPIDSTKIQIFTRFIRSILDNLSKDTSPLYPILFMNDNSPSAINRLDYLSKGLTPQQLFKTVGSLESLHENETWTYDANGLQNYCLCLHLNLSQIDGCNSGIGKILHYFTLVHFNTSDKWFLNSSYGSV